MEQMEKRPVFLLRHGMTEGNRQKKYIGITDDPLCEAGIQDIRQWKPTLELPRIGALFVSPLLRCRQTAAILFPDLEQIVVPELAEMNFGIFENRAFAGDLEHSGAYQKWLDSYCEAQIPQGECRADFEERCAKGFLRALQMAPPSPGLAAAFVVHGGTIMSVMHRFAQPSREYYQWNPANGHGFLGCWDGTGITAIQNI